MVPVLVGILVVVFLFVIVMAASRRTPASDDGVADFQRHLSALSPEARRVVLDRERPVESDSEVEHGA